KPDTLVGAIYDSVASDMDVHALHQGYLRGMREHGAELRNSARVESATYEEAKDGVPQGVASMHNSGVWRLRTSNGEELRARVVVNAAGAWADAVARQCGAKALGVQPMRRSAFL